MALAHTQIDTMFQREKAPFCFYGRKGGFLTAQMSVFMVFCGPHLPLAFQFVCAPGGGGSSPFLNKQFYERGNSKLFEKGFF